MTSPAAEATPPASPPVADRRPVTTEHHGRTRTDEYDWLRAKGTPEVTAYLEAENAWTAAATDHLAGLRDAIFGEIKSRTKETDLSVPTRNRGYWYYGRSFEGREYGTSLPGGRCSTRATGLPRLRTRTPGRTSRRFPASRCSSTTTRSPRATTSSPSAASRSAPTRHLLAYSTDTVGDERYVLEVKDLSTGELLPDRIEGVLGGGVWSPDGRDLYYCTVDDAWRRDKVWRHRIGSTDRRRAGVPRDRRAVLGRRRTQPHPALPGDRERLQEHLRVPLPRLRRPGRPSGSSSTRARRGCEYSLEHAVIGGEDRFLVLHDHAGADFELGSAPVAATPPSGWTPLIPHDERGPPRGRRRVRRTPGRAPAQRRADPAPDPRARRRPGPGDDYLVEFPQELYTVGSGGGPQFDQPVGAARLHVDDGAGVGLRLRRAHPRAARCSSAAGPWPRPRGLRGAPAVGDRRRRRAGPDLDRRPGSAPAASAVRSTRSRSCSTATAPTRSRSTRTSRSPGCRCSTAAPGWPIAHVRGGGEMGRRWYDDGQAAAQAAHLLRLRRLRPAPGRHRLDHPRTELVGEGGSAGGLLIGVVANEHRDLFGGIVAEVPFVDALTSMLDASLPLTVTEYDEWGNPRRTPRSTTTWPATRRTRTSTAQRYPPILADDLGQRHPGALRRARQVGGPAARDRARPARTPRHPAEDRDVGRSRRRLAGATRPGATGRSSWPGCSTGWASPMPAPAVGAHA